MPERIHARRKAKKEQKREAREELDDLATQNRSEIRQIDKQTKRTKFVELGATFVRERFADTRCVCVCVCVCVCFDLAEIPAKFSPRNVGSFRRGWLSFRVKWLVHRGGAEEGGRVCHVG